MCPVKKEFLKLSFNPGTCVKCFCGVRSLKGEGIECTPSDVETAGNSAVPYGESHCHPILLPKYTQLQKIKEGIVYYILLKYLGQGKPDYSAEVCPRCDKGPGSFGCMKVGEMYYDLLVDHSSEIDDHRLLEQDEMSGDATDEDAENGGDGSEAAERELGGARGGPVEERGYDTASELVGGGGGGGDRRSVRGVTGKEPANIMTKDINNKLVVEAEVYGP